MTEVQNPFQEHIDLCADCPATLQLFYEFNRFRKIADAKKKILDNSFTGWAIDSTLAKLHGPKRDPNFVDPRHCIAICVSPPENVKAVIRRVQAQLCQIVPNIWLTPEANLHMTVLEIASSKAPQEVENMLTRLQPAFPGLAKATETRFSQPRLIKPTLTFDSSAVAISFVPASNRDRDRYTYHHLRRDTYDMVAATGVSIGSRYFAPSAHVTLGRFITQEGFTRPKAEGRGVDQAKVGDVIKGFERINRWLEDEYTQQDDGNFPNGGMWVVGEEKKLECRKGTIWYGGGENVLQGQDSQPSN